jgi:hypothetical protein
LVPQMLCFKLFTTQFVLGACRKGCHHVAPWAHLRPGGCQVSHGRKSIAIVIFERLFLVALLLELNSPHTSHLFRYCQ